MNKTTRQIDEAAREILHLNDRGGYTVPTEGLYPYQWNWDSAFAAAGFAQFDTDRAWAELETLFSGQWDNGMVPHILFHKVDPGYFPGTDVWHGRGPIPSSGVSQPPVAATMARLVFEKDPQLGKARFQPLLSKFIAYHRWFMEWRLDRGAVCITHPWEAGRDNAPDWDGAMAVIRPDGVGGYTRRDTTHVDASMRPTNYDYDRYIWLVQRGARLQWNEAEMLKDTPFRVADPTMTFILLRACRDLAWLATELGQDTTEIATWIATLEAGADSLWNENLGSYDARDARSGQWANSVSNASFLCWYAGIDSPKMRRLLRDVLAAVRYGVPSLDARDTRFDGLRYWRGPVWAIMNMMIGTGLLEHDHSEGEDVLQSTTDLIRDHGFAEYFNPLDGTPAGGKSFTWTAAVWLSWASPTVRQG